MKFFTQLFSLLIFMTAIINSHYILNTQYESLFIFLTAFFSTIGVLATVGEIYDIINYYSKDSE